MLRKLIGIPQINRALNKTFSEMANILAVSASPINRWPQARRAREQLASMVVTPERTRSWFVRCWFSGDFVRAVAAFDRQMTSTRKPRKRRRASANIFRLAQEARERLKTAL